MSSTSTPIAPRAHDRIAVIGGGPGGLHMARMLVDRGFQHVTVYEASARLGGKVESIEREGEVFDLGAAVVPLGGPVEALARRYGQELVPIPRDNYNMTAQRLAGVGLRARVLRRLLSPSLIRGFRALLGRYPVDALLADPRHPQWAELSRPLAQVAGPHCSNQLLQVCTLLLHGYGYGTIDEIPAWYGLRMLAQWFEPLLLRQTAMATQGYQRLWEAIGAELDVRFETPIRKIETGEGGVQLHTDDGVEHFDFVVNSVPWVIADPGSAELFASVRAADYFVGLTTMSRRPARISTSTHTQPGRIKLAVAQGAIRAGRKVNPDEEAVTVYLAPDHRADALGDVRELARDRLTHEFEAGEDFEHARTWRYLPMFSERALRAGAPASVWCDQGRRRVWNIGAAASMESVPNIVDYNLRLLAACGL